MAGRLTIEDVLSRISNLLDERGWTLYKLAEITGIPHSSLYTMMQRRTMPKHDTLSAICDGLGISLSDFFIQVSEGKSGGYLSQNELLLVETLRPLPEKYIEMTIVYAKGLSDAYKTENQVKQSAKASKGKQSNKSTNPNSTKV